MVLAVPCDRHAADATDRAGHSLIAGADGNHLCSDPSFAASAQIWQGRPDIAVSSVRRVEFARNERFLGGSERYFR